MAEALGPSAMEEQPSDGAESGSSSNSDGMLTRATDQDDSSSDSERQALTGQPSAAAPAEQAVVQLLQVRFTHNSSAESCTRQGGRNA